MTGVFISYKREDLAKVQRLVQALREHDADVWWDQDIAPDAPWETTIEHELAAAKVAIVAWSQAAVASDNVKAEARSARKAGKLIQVFVEKCEQPMFFGERQGVDLSDWNGDARDHRFQAVLMATRAVMAGKRPAQGVGYAPKERKPWIALSITGSITAAAVGFVANLGSARDAICAIGALQQTCVKVGLVVAEDATAARTRLLQSIVGRWGRQDRDCSETVSYSVSQDRDGIDRIIVSAPDFESVGQVIAVENGIILSRTTTPSPTGGREQWELRPQGDQMVVLDKDGVATTLVRCGS